MTTQRENLAAGSFSRTLEGIIESSKVIHTFGELAVRNGADPEELKAKIYIAAESLKLIGDLLDNSIAVPNTSDQD